MVNNWDEFLKIEKEYGLNQLEIDGCNYWEYGRSMLMEYIIKFSLGSANVKNVSSVIFNGEKLKKAYRLARFILRSRFLRGKLNKHYDVLFSSSVNRVPYKGKAYNTFVDPIMEEYESSILLEPSYMFMKHSKNPYSKAVCYIDYYEANSIISYYIHRLTRDFKKNLQNVKEQLAEPLNEMCKLYDIDSIPESVYVDMVDCIARRKVFKKFCKNVLSKTTPKVIVETCHYSFENLVLNETAYEMGIPVVELQHGRIGKSHSAYNYPEGILVKQLPSYLFVFSKYWADGISLPMATRRIQPVGAPYKEIRAKEAIAGKMQEKKGIVFLSENREFSLEFAKIAIRLNELIDKNEYEIIFKLHPKEYPDWRKKYQDMADTDINVIASNETDLYDIFASSTVQVCSFGSTTVYEGLLFGLKTFINLNYASPEYLDLCEKGYAEGFFSEEDLFEKVKSAYKTDGENEFWEVDSLQKTKCALDAIICNGRL